MAEIQTRKADNLAYITGAAQRSSDSFFLWLKYLRKVVTKEGAIFTTEEIDKLVHSPKLAIFQRATIQALVKPGSSFHEQVYGMNVSRKAVPLREFLNKYESFEESS